MYMHLLMLVVFAGVTAALWFHGLWSNVVTSVNLVAAMFISLGFTPPLIAWMLGQESIRSYIFVLVFIVFWLMFAIAYNILRLLTDLTSRRKIQFPPLFELIGRSVAAPINGLLIASFVAATLHFAPLARIPFAGGWPPSFLGLPADRMLMGAFALASKGSLSADEEFETKDHIRGAQGFRSQLESLDGYLVE